MADLPEDVTRALDAIAALSPKLAAKQWRGAWDTRAKYASGDLINFNGRAFFSLTNANVGNRPDGTQLYWYPVQPVVSKTVAGMTSVATGDGLDGDGTPGSPLRLDGSALGTPTPAPDSVPQSLGSGELSRGWMPQIPQNSCAIYCSPDGDDDAPGDRLHPKRTLYEGYRACGLEGAGLLEYVYGTEVGGPIGSQGLWLRGDGRNIPGWLGALPITIRGVGRWSSAGFQKPSPAAFIGGGTVVSKPVTSIREFPPIWVAFSFVPTIFENVMPSGLVRQVARVGWDYTRHPNGDIVKLAITAAERQGGETQFTVTLPPGYAISAASRVANVTTLTIPSTLGATYAYPPWRIGQVVRVTSSDPGFPSGDYPITFVSNPVTDGGNWLIRYADVGDDDTGTTIGTVQSHACGSLEEGEYVEFQSAVGEDDFKSTMYRVVGHGADTITVTDPYGDDVSLGAIGFLLHQERAGYGYSGTIFRNCSGKMDVSGNNAIYNGPEFDVGFTSAIPALFEDCWLTGQEPMGTPRDYDRQAAIFVNPGSRANSGVPACGVFVRDCDSAGGGVRVRVPSDGLAKVIVQDYTGESTAGGGGAAPSLDVLSDGSRIVSVYARNVFNADNDTEFFNVRVIGVPADGVDVKHCGAVDIPGGGVCGDRWDYPPVWTPAGDQSQTPASPWVGNRITNWANGRISGKHPAGVRALGALSARFKNLILAPSSWVPGAQTTQTDNVLAPDGSSGAIRLASTLTNLSVLKTSGPTGDTWTAGGRFVVGGWCRSDGYQPAAFQVNTTGGVVFTNDLANFTVDSPFNADGWQWIAGCGEVDTTSITNPNVTIYAVTATGAFLELYGVVAFYVPSTVHDNDFYEFLGNLRHQPRYLPQGMTGTMDDQKFIAHGGIGTGLTYVEGVASGQVTIVGSFTPKKYEPIYTAAGVLKGFVELLDGSVNP